MSQARKDWETFKAWELKVCIKLNPNLLIPKLTTEIYNQWRLRSNQTELAGSLRVLQKSLQDAENSRAQVKGRQQAIREPSVRRSDTASLRQLQDLEQHIEHLLNDLRLCVGHIQNLGNEQNSGVAGDLSVDLRSTEYTQDLLTQIRSHITETEKELTNCKDLLIEGSAGSPARDAPQNDAAPRDEGTDGQQQGRKSEAHAQGGQHSNGNGQHQQFTRQGGDVDPAGTGAGAPNGSEHSRRGNERPRPASRNSAVVPDGDGGDKSGDDPEEDDAPQPADQRQTRSQTRQISGRSQAPGAEDNGTEARRTPAESNMLDALEAALPGNVVNGPPLSSSQKGTKSGQEKKTTAPDGSHGSSSSSSGSDDGEPSFRSADRKRRTPNEKETRSRGNSSSHASKRQRLRKPNERGEQDDLPSSSSPAEPRINGQPRTAFERLLDIPGPIHDYARQALDEQTGLPDIDPDIVVDMVMRLHAAYGDDWEWDEASTLR